MVDDGDYQLRLAARIEHYRELGDLDAVDALGWMRAEGKCPRLYSKPKRGTIGGHYCWIQRYPMSAEGLPALLYNLLGPYGGLHNVGVAVFDSIEAAEDALIDAWRKTDPDERRVRGIPSPTR